jgi:hypothetical protein
VTAVAGTAPVVVSVVLATSSAEAVRRSLAAYRAQSWARRVEVVVVAPAGELAVIAAEGAPELARLLPVAAEEPFELAPARALGIESAGAPWVFVGETHSFPAPTLFERLFAALERLPRPEPPHCLIPTLDNANPSGASSWASLLIDYGAWGPGHAEGASMPPPIYNALFDRSRLVRGRAELVRALSPHDETLFPLGAGHAARSRFVPEATIDHLNVDRLGDLLRTKRWLGLAIGANRARRWGWGRRLAYAAAAPLIAVVLLRRYLAATRIVGAARKLPRGIAPRLALGAVWRAAGEAQAYVGLEPDGVEARLQHLEIHKADFVAGWRS